MSELDRLAELVNRTSETVQQLAKAVAVHEDRWKGHFDVHDKLPCGEHATQIGSLEARSQRAGGAGYVVVGVLSFIGAILIAVISGLVVARLGG